MKLQSLIDLAYRFYPENIRESDRVSYTKSTEYGLLKRAIEEGKKKLDPAWRSMLGDLHAAFQDRQVSELPAYPEDRCYKATINLKWAKLEIVEESVPESIVPNEQLPYPQPPQRSVYFEEHLAIYISLVTPYYAFCKLSAAHGLRMQSSNFNIDRSSDPFKRSTSIIRQYLPDYDEFPPHFSYQVLERIEIDRSTYCYDTGSHFQPPAMTLFHAFFTSHLI